MKQSILILTLLAAWAVPQARADLVLEFGQTSYSVMAGETVDIPLYLTQTGGETILSDEGLFSAGVIVHFNVSPYTADPAQLMSVTPNPDFNFVDPITITPASSISAGSANLSEAAFTIIGAVYPTMNRILLGTFSFQAGMAPGTTLVDVIDFDPMADDFVTPFGTVLDPSLSFGTTRIIVSAVPEPATVVQVMLGTVGLGLYRLRRLRRRR